MKKIWFNHWFSTAYHFIKSLRDDPLNHVIATNKRRDCVYQTVANEFYTEPDDISGKEYVDWCFEFCIKHEIDVFFIRREMSAIIKEATRFSQIGVKLIADTSIAQHKLLSSKFDSTEYVRENNLCNTPLMFRVSTAAEFTSAYSALKKKYGKSAYLCMKDDTDEGGGTYKKICDQYTPHNKYDVPIDDVNQEFIDNKVVYPRVVMPYMEGPEISIDCMQTNGDDGLIAIPRLKVNSRFTEIRFDAELLSIARRISSRIRIEYPYNIQLRKLNGEYTFMEINMRMAGGSFKDEAVGCYFARLALAYACGEPIDAKKIKRNFSNKYLGNIEDFIIL